MRINAGTAHPYLRHKSKWQERACELAHGHETLDVCKLCLQVDRYNTSEPRDIDHVSADAMSLCMRDVRASGLLNSEPCPCGSRKNCRSNGLHRRYVVRVNHKRRRPPKSWTSRHSRNHDI